MGKIVSVKIHPAIGIARIGNSPTGIFVGPQKPGVHHRPSGGYRDPQGRIKRQVARFRLFGYDSKGRVVREITAKEATITWTVHLANKKAEWIQFQGPKSRTDETLRRNAAVIDRDSLVIDPGPRSLTDRNRHATFGTGAFMGTIVPLGEMRTDRDGRLLVLGGFGRSSSPINKPIREGEFANNDGWHDDVSDGPVKATVRLNENGAEFNAAGSWVICAVPKFAPQVEHVVTLYDTLLQVAVDKLGLKLPAKPSFGRDVYPILRRAVLMKWVSAVLAHPPAHGHGLGGHEHDENDHHDEHDDELPAHHTLAKALAGAASASERRAIFERLRDPAVPAGASSGESDMPMIHSDVYPLDTNQPLTRVQYAVMKQWAQGHFIHDVPVSAATLPDTPEGLDRAALESCVGGAFYPGIEASWLLRDVYVYSEPFRLDQSDLQAGDVTKQLAVPWQADFADCQQEEELAWWPAQRPDAVFPEDGGPQVGWARGIIGTTHSMSDMVKKWHRLGFVVKRGSRYVETERN